MMINQQALIDRSQDSISDRYQGREYGVVRYDLANDFHPVMSEYGVNIPQLINDRIWRYLIGEIGYECPVF